MFIEIIIAMVLLVLSVMDIISKRIPLLVIVGLIVIAMVSSLILHPVDVLLMVAGAAVGLVFVLISKATREKLGYGDSWIILALGILLGFWEVMILILIAFLASACFGIIMMCWKKKNKNSSFPFVPFIALSYVLVTFVL